jgi:hypothetical protein
MRGIEGLLEYGFRSFPTSWVTARIIRWQARETANRLLRNIRQDIDAAITEAADGKEFIRSWKKRA